MNNNNKTIKYLHKQLKDIKNIADEEHTLNIFKLLKLHFQVASAAGHFIVALL